VVGRRAAAFESGSSDRKAGETRGSGACCRGCCPRCRAGQGAAATPLHSACIVLSSMLWLLRDAHSAAQAQQTLKQAWLLQLDGSANNTVLATVVDAVGARVRLAVPLLAL